MIIRKRVSRLNCEKYLKRIGISNNKLEPTYDCLKMLIENHLYHIPFENYDVMDRVPLSYEPAILFNKIVINRRGGFCYEVNYLFHLLLLELGFQSQLISGRVIRRSSGYGPQYDHLALVVTIDQSYLVDVGFGDAMRIPLPLTGEEQTDTGGTFKVITTPIEGETHVLQKKNNDGDWNTRYIFTLQQRSIIEFNEMFTFHQTSPESPFTQGGLITIATPEGRITLNDRTFSITHRGEKKSKEIQSNEEMLLILQKHFGFSDYTFTEVEESRDSLQ